VNQNKAIPILLGIGITLGFLASYLWSNSLLDIFNMSIGIMVLIIGFYNENKKNNYLIALFCVNIIQWFILIYIYYNHITKTEFYYYLIGALLFTIVLADQVRKNNRKAEVINLKDKRSFLLFTGIVIIIGCLAGFIAYLSFIFLYGVTLGLMTIIVGFYYEDNKLNVSNNYAKVMGFVLILQWLIFIFFFRQFSGEDLVNAISFSMMITIYFLIQIHNISLISISNKKKEMIVGIGAIILFITLFGAFYQIGYTQFNTTENKNITNSYSTTAENKSTISDIYSVTDASYKTDANILIKSFSDSRINFNYPDSWIVDKQWNRITVSKEKEESDTKFQVQIEYNNGKPEEDILNRFIENIENNLTESPKATYKIIVDNKTAYENIYTFTDFYSEKLIKYADIFLVKNDKSYYISLQAPDEEFDKEKPNFAVILNSFKVN